jgi:hypothetical protein
MRLEDEIADYLSGSPHSKARDIAAALRTDRSQVNSVLYRAVNMRFRVDGDYRWSLIQNSSGDVPVCRTVQSSTEITGIVGDATVLRARRTLARLKRGVPPAEAIDDLAIGMERLRLQLEQLFAEKAEPRWLAVTGEYGEGKSFFRAFACRRAMEAGFAVASLDVNKNDGAMHQPQRHISVVLQSLMSARELFAGQQGVNSLVRHWLTHSPQESIEEGLDRMRRVTPWLPVNRDVMQFMDLTRGSASSMAADGRMAHLLRFLSAEDLVIKGNYARLSAAYRLQLVIEWLRLTGHRGLFLFIDELDNVVRQIHAKAHPACFRTLAWYCSNESTLGLRVAFATTPEVMNVLDGGNRDAYGETISLQKTVFAEEHQIYQRWNREAGKYASHGWERCVSLDAAQRVDLFHRIANLHSVAWSNGMATPTDEIDQLATSPIISTTRRWVRACIQLLDLRHQHCPGK